MADPPLVVRAICPDLYDQSADTSLATLPRASCTRRGYWLHQRQRRATTKHSGGCEHLSAPSLSWDHSLAAAHSTSAVHLFEKVHYSSIGLGGWVCLMAGLLVTWRGIGPGHVADGRHCEDDQRAEGSPGGAEPEDSAGADYGRDWPGGGKRGGAGCERADQLNAPTRNRARAGMRCCVTVASSAVPSADPRSASSAPPATATASAGHGQESSNSTRSEGQRAGTLRARVISVASLAWAKAAR
jgi:hypothetical protein